MLRPVVPFVIATLSGVLAFTPVHINHYAAADGQGAHFTVVGHLTRGWVFSVAPQGRRSGQTLFETAHLVLNTDQELAAECHAYRYVGHSKTLLERTSSVIQRGRSELPAEMLDGLGQSQNAATWLQQLTELCRSGVGAEKTLMYVRTEGDRYVPTETPQVAVMVAAPGSGWLAQVVKR